MTAGTLAILAAHLVADFPLQTDKMAAQKFESWRVRAVHALVHAPFYLPAALLAFQSDLQAVIFTAIATAGHFLVDTRRWGKPKDHAPWWPIAVDQTMHVTTLALAAAAVEVVVA